jgi:hypothetical protein
VNNNSISNNFTYSTTFHSTGLTSPPSTSIINHSNINNNNNNSSPHSSSNKRNETNQEYYNQTLDLSELLASLAIESDAVDRHLAAFEKNEKTPSIISTSTTVMTTTTNGLTTDDDIFDGEVNRSKYLKQNGSTNSPSETSSSHSGSNYPHTDENTNELSVVIANLQDYNNEHNLKVRQTSLNNNFSNNSHFNGNTNHPHINSTLQRYNNNHIKRLGSVSESSLSISPSLSDKSNGVSWSDQVNKAFFKPGVSQKKISNINYIQMELTKI